MKPNSKLFLNFIDNYQPWDFSILPSHYLSDSILITEILRKRLFGYKSSSYNISYIHDSLKSNHIIARLAIKIDTSNFKEISKDLQDNLNFHYSLIRDSEIDYSDVFAAAPESIRGNRKLVLSLITRHSSIYQYITDDLYSDRDLLFLFLEQKINLKFIPLSFNSDKDIVLKIIDNVSKYDEEKTYSSYRVGNINWLLSFISKELINEKEILLKLVFNFKNLPISIPDYLSDDRELMLAVVKNMPEYYRQLSVSLRMDHEIAIESFKGDPQLFLETLGHIKLLPDTMLEFITYIFNLRMEDDKDLNSILNGPRIRNSLIENIINSLINNNLFNYDITLAIISKWPYRVRFINYYDFIDHQLRKDKRVIEVLIASSDSERWNIEPSEKYNNSTEFIYENYVLPFFPNDKELVMQIIKKDTTFFHLFPSLLKEDDEIILLALSYASLDDKNNILSSLPYSLRTNKNFFLKMLSQVELTYYDESLLVYAAQQLLDSEEFITEAININPISIKHASNRLKNNIDFQKLAFLNLHKEHFPLNRLTRKGSNYYYKNKQSKDLEVEFLKLYCQDLLTNRSFCIDLTEGKFDKQDENGISSLSFHLKIKFSDIVSITDVWKGDYLFMMQAIKENPTSYQFIAQSLKSDPDLAFEMINHFVSNPLKESQLKCKELFSMTTIDLRKDKKFCIKALGMCGYLIEHISKDLYNDSDIIAIAIKSDGKLIQYASESLKGDIDFIQGLFTNNLMVPFSYLDKDIQSKKDIIKLALKRNITYDYLSEINLHQIFSDKILFIEFVDYLIKLPRHVYEDNQDIKKVIDLRILLSYVTNDIRSDAQSVLCALSLSLNNYQFVSSSLTSDKEFIQELLNRLLAEIASSNVKPSSISIALIYKRLPDSLKDNKEIAFLAVKIDYRLYHIISERLKEDFDIAEYVLSIQPGFLKEISYKLLLNRKFMRIGICYNPSIYLQLNKTLQNELEIALNAISNAKDNYIIELYAKMPFKIRNNIQLIKEAIKKDYKVLKLISKLNSMSEELFIYASGIIKEYSWNNDIGILAFCSKELRSNENFIRKVIVGKANENIKYVNRKIRFSAAFLKFAIIEGKLSPEFIPKKLFINNDLIGTLINNCSSNYDLKVIASKIPKNKSIPSNIWLALIKKEYDFQSLEYESKREYRIFDSIIPLKLKNDITFIMEAIKSVSSETQPSWIRSNGYYNLYLNASEKVKRNQEVANLAVQWDGSLFENIDKRLWSSEQIIITAIKSGYSSFWNLGKQILKMNKNTAIKYLQSGGIIEMVRPEFQNDKEIVLAALSGNYRNISKINNNFLFDREVISVLFSNNNISRLQFSEIIDNNLIISLLVYIPEIFFDDKELMQKAVSSNIHILKFVSERLNNDKDFIIDFIQSDGLVLEYVNPRFRNYKYILKLAVASNPLSFKLASEKLQCDVAFVAELLKSYNIYRYLPGQIANEELIKTIYHEKYGTLDREDYHYDEDYRETYSQRDYFDVMTDGQYGDYDDFIDQGYSIDDLGPMLGR